MSPWWDPEAPLSHADDAEAPPPSPPSPPGGLSRAFTALGTVGTSLSSLFSKAPPPLLSGAPHQRAAVLSRSAPPAQPYQTLLPGVTAAAAAQSTAAAAAAAVDAAQATAPAAAGTTRGRRRSTLSGQRKRQRQQVESATLALGSTWLQRKRWGRTEPTERGCWAAAGRPEVHARYAVFHPQATQRVGAPKVTGGGGGGGYGGGRRGGGGGAENLARAAHAPSGEPARGAAERTHQSYPENGGTSIMHLCWVFTSPRTAPKLSIHNQSDDQHSAGAQASLKATLATRASPAQRAGLWLGPPVPRSRLLGHVRPTRPTRATPYRTCAGCPLRQKRQLFDMHGPKLSRLVHSGQRRALVHCERHHVSDLAALPAAGVQRILSLRPSGSLWRTCLRVPKQ